MSRIAQIEQLLIEQPEDSFLKHALALEYVKTGNDQKAREIFESLLSAEPEYVGSYYHLAKLHERNGNEAEAISVYEKGMEIAKQAGDRHALSELRSAYEDFTF